MTRQLTILITTCTVGVVALVAGALRTQAEPGGYPDEAHGFHDTLPQFDRIGGQEMLPRWNSHGEAVHGEPLH